MIELYKATRPCYGVIETGLHIARFGFTLGFGLNTLSKGLIGHLSWNW
jgi:hypothetical protein